MKNILGLLLFFSIATTYAQPAVCDYAYMRSLGIYAYSVATKQEYQLAPRGQDAAISPDGSRVAYTATNKKGGRYILIYDLATKKKTLLNTGNADCYGAAWSPDGKMLLYNAYLGSHWEMGVINSDNTAARLLGKEADDVYSPVWMPDGKRIMVQNGKVLEYINLSGNVTPVMELSKLEGGAPELKDMVGSSSDDRFIFTADKGKIVFSSGTNENVALDGPPDAVFVYDVATGKTHRLSKRGYDAGAVVLSGNKVLFNTSKFNGSTVNIAQENLDGTDYKILFAGCLDVSVRR